MTDITTPIDLRRLVTHFYAAVRADADLGPIFDARIRDEDWPEHLDTMTRFWSSVMLAMPVYHGNPLGAHRGLALEAKHFTRWLALWRASVDELYDGPRARDIVARATRIANVLSQRLEVA